MPLYPGQKHQIVVQCDPPDNPYSRDEAESDEDAGEDEEDDGDDEDLGSAVLHDETRSLGEVREVHGQWGHGLMERTGEKRRGRGRRGGGEEGWNWRAKKKREEKIWGNNRD